MLWEPAAFEETLVEAERAPDDGARFEEDFDGNLDDVVLALQDLDIGEE